MSLRDARDLLGPDAHHVLVVLRVVVDVAGAVFLLEAADAVHQSRRAGDRPRPRQRLGVAQVGPEVAVVVGRIRERHADVGQRLDVGQQPGLGAVGEVPVGEQDDRRPVLRARCAPPRTRRRSSGSASAAATTGSGASPWRPYMASSRSDCSVFVGSPVDGPPRCTSTTMSGSSRLIASPIALGLQVHARAAGRGDAEVPGERGADRHAGRADLVLGLERADAEVLVRRQLVEDVGRRRDRVRRVGDRELALLRRGDQPVRRAATLPVMLR